MSLLIDFYDYLEGALFSREIIRKERPFDIAMKNYEVLLEIFEVL